jgi:hypothetical protein
MKLGFVTNPWEVMSNVCLSIFTRSELTVFWHITNSVKLSPSWEATSRSATQEFPNIFCTQKFNTVYARAIHWSPSWVKTIHSIPPHPISLRFILILSSQQRLGFPSGQFPSGFPTNILYTFLFFTTISTYKYVPPSFVIFSLAYRPGYCPSFALHRPVIPSQEYGRDNANKIGAGVECAAQCSKQVTVGICLVRFLIGSSPCADRLPSLLQNEHLRLLSN